MSTLLDPMTVLLPRRRSFIVITMLIIYHLYPQVAMNMDFGSDSWGEDDSWGDDGDDGDDGWKRRKREAKEKTETMKRKAETVEKTRKKRRVVDEEVETEEENKRFRREAAAKWRKGTQVCPVSSHQY